MSYIIGFQPMRRRDLYRDVASGGSGFITSPGAGERGLDGYE
jgi:hypothetical protein